MKATLSSDHLPIFGRFKLRETHNYCPEIPSVNLGVISFLRAKSKMQTFEICEEN